MSILKRTIYYDNTRGIASFWDWATVTTTIGAMVEPFVVGQKLSANTSIAAFDPEDEINRIDSIRAMPLHKEKVLLSGDNNYALHGGSTAAPRVGR